MEKSKLWTREYVLITFTNFFLALNYFLLMVIVSEYAMDKFNATTGSAGIASGVFVAGALATRLLIGKWLALLGYKQMLTIGLIANLLMSVAYFATSSIAILYCVRFIHGASFGIASLSAITTIADIVPSERRGEGMGYFVLSNTLATAIGPFLAISLSRSGNYGTLFFICSAAAAISLSVMPFLSIKKVKLTEEQKFDLRGFKLSNCIEPGVIPIAIVSLLFFLCYTSVLSFISAYSKDLNLTEAAGAFFIVFAAVNVVSRPYAGKRFDKKGENSIMYCAFPIFSVGLLLFSQTHHGITMLLSAVLIGAGFGSLVACTQAIIVKITPRHRLGLANSTFYLFSDVGVGAGPMLVGFLIPYTGYGGMYVISSIIALLGLPVYFLLHGRKAAKEERIAINIE